jgi:hypothetical protein
MAVAPLGFKGKALPVLNFLSLMADTEAYETDPDWWRLRTMLIEKDGGTNEQY